MDEELTDHQRMIQNYMGRHIVSLRGVYRPSGEAANTENDQSFNFSAFVFSLREDWFLFTAGHILARIAEAREAGMIVEGFRLDDAYSPDAPFKKRDELTPFDFDNAPKHFIDRPELGDFAAVWLSPYYRQLLSKNNIQPFSPEEMAVHPYAEKFMFYWLIGLPEELMSVEGEGDDAWDKSQLVLMKVDPLKFEDLPGRIKSRIEDEGFHKDNFFAQIPAADELTDRREPGLQSIVGMSGGPLIGWRRNSEGKLGYSLIAVQSIWWESERILMACPAVRYVVALDQTIQKATIRTTVSPTSDFEGFETSED